MSEVVPLLQSIANRLEAIELHLGITGGGNASASGSEDLPRSIRAFDAYCRDNLDPFVEACDKLGGDAATVGHLVKDAWNEMRSFLIMATACKEPPQTSLGPLLSKIGEKTREISNCVQRNEWEKHTKTCQEGVQCLNWLVVKPAPRDFIESYIGGSDYWANNIRREYRTTNPDHVAFCDTFKKLLQELMVYVKEYHTTGVTWNPKGCDVSEYNSSSAPPPAAPAASASKPAPTTSAAAPKADLFAALNKEGAVTKGLKTVTKEQQTWRKEFKGGDTPAPAPVPKKAPAPKKDVVKGPAKLEFQPSGSKWLVEYQTGEAGQVTVQIADKKETVYIYGCVGANINVVGKCKSIILDGCKRTALHFDSAFASLETVNCQRIQVHCRENVPSVAIDKTDGILVHLPASSLDTEVTASKSSEMNLCFPGPDGEPIERPIPEQYIHRIHETSITADVTDLYNA
mmetsp:Transcript_760/g.1260  ORF Transcript_760/g.1260 Transcript_760/m.1260 type:complete len:458 (-) Transcript_760:133-1506(-)|eukprot:CAMPEP_0185024608 /NCGR_PEP_ID=MMETSP1103-20130426/7744_1 /TAXON_ID=36769 /ORGANISM="Paraphysomonas bandaiensis, Strain Caron Lab Isolate" /LENGTH=457 /DNA_ID=CAMNT_0027557625 /DNA_START=45 /DNA_END=1418 /DNA_ORIENTATION=+